MTTNRHEMIVIGFDTTGSAMGWRLAQRSVRGLGIDKFSVPHTNGVHHGGSRVIRKAYFEHPDCVPIDFLGLSRFG